MHSHAPLQADDTSLKALLGLVVEMGVWGEAQAGLKPLVAAAKRGVVRCEARGALLAEQAVAKRGALAEAEARMEEWEEEKEDQRVRQGCG